MAFTADESHLVLGSSSGGLAIYLVNDAGTGSTGPLTPGAPGTLSNSQCTISNGGAATPAGNNLTVPVTITFAAGFTGTKTVFAYAGSSSNGASGWETVGTWLTH